MSISGLIIFSLTIFLVSIVPGPSMLLALSNGIKYGAKRTVFSAMGNVLVTLIQASISIAGLGTIILKSSTIFISIKWIGSAYLLFLGVKILITKKRDRETIHITKTDSDKSNKSLFIQSILVTASNPKAILFLLQYSHNLSVLRIPFSYNQYFY